MSGSATSSNVQLTWTASTDNVRVTGYRIHRDATANFTPTAANQVGQTTSTTFNETAPTGTYLTRVVAVDQVQQPQRPLHVRAGDSGRRRRPLDTHQRHRHPAGPSAP